MALLFADSFVRANNAVVDATNWEENAAAADWRLNTNAVDSNGATSSLNTALLTKAAAHAATTDVKVSVTQISTSGDGGPCARWTAGTSGVTGGSPNANSTGYLVDAYGSIIEIYRYSAGVSTILGTGVAITRTANAVIRIEVEGTGGTVTIRSYYNDVLKQTYSDTAAGRIVTGERTGIVNWATAAVQYKDFQVDDFVGGASVALTGTALAGIDETDIVAGGKTIVMTLTGDTFIPN